MKDHYSRQIDPVVKYNPNKRKQAQEAIQQEIQQQVAPENIPQPLPTPTPTSGDLRGSLANSVNIDLVEPAPSSTRTIRRI